MRAILLCLLVVFAGCGNGPRVDVVRKHVTERLADALPAGTLTLAALERRGSQADTKAPAGETRRVVYFDAELKLERDFQFGAWNEPGVAGLISALGAGPKGLTGLNSGGNKAGDILRVHGTALYKRDGDAWTPVVSGGYRPAEAPSVATNAPQTNAAVLLASMRDVIASEAGASPAHRAVIEQELTAARAAIRSRLARLNEGYGLAAGPEHGQYLRFARAIANDKTAPLVTRGGEENLRLLRDGKVVLALAQGDSALDAYEGRGPFAADGPHAVLRALGSLYPEPVHVLVRADSAFSSVASLARRRVAIGEEGSASRTTVLRVLDAHGLGPGKVQTLDLALGAALVALRRGEVDAVMQVIGMPADNIRDALAEIPLRLLPLSDSAVARLVATKGGYFAYTIPAGTYGNQKEAVRTVATAAMLVAGTGLSASEVETLTRFVFGKERDLAARGSAQGVQVSAANARLGLSIPLHSASVKTLDALVSGAASEPTPR